MRKLLAILLFALPAMGATGDVTGAAIGAGGWDLYIWTEGHSTNGTFADFGFDTNNIPSGNEKVVLTLSTPGHEGTTEITRQLTIYGTKQIRFPYPSDDYPDVVIDGTAARWRVSLSDYVAAGDTAITLDLAAGVYTEGGIPSAAATGLTVTNNSTQPYTKAVFNWRPGSRYRRATGDTMRIAGVGFHGSAGGGQPLAAVTFITTDETGNSVLDTQTEMRIDRDSEFGQLDIFPTGIYYSDVPLAGFVNHEQLRSDFVAYPRRGDSTAVFDTRDDVYTGVTPLPSSITNLCDRLNNYSDGIAVVATTGGAGGQVTNVAPESVDSAHYFASIAAAHTALAAYNLANFGHEDSGGSIIYVRDGVTAWTGASHTATTIPKAVVTVMNYPGEAPVFTSDTGANDLADRIKIQGITLGGSVNFFSGIDYMHLDQVTIDNDHLALAQTTKVIDLTHSSVPHLEQGLRGFSTQDTSWLLWGCNLDGFDGQIVSKVLVGNYRPDASGGEYSISTDSTSGQPSGAEYGIWYNNYFGGLTTAGAASVDIGKTIAITNGMAIVQNVFELCTNTAAASFSIGSPNSLNFTNIIGFNNVFVGKRVAGTFYNDQGTAAAYRWLCVWKHNYFDNTGFKSDNFVGGENGNRIGNWPVMWNVGWEGNFFAEVNTTADESAGNFNPEFRGLYSYHPPGEGAGQTNEVSYIKFIDRRSQGGSINPAPGGGNYRVHSYSPGLGLARGDFDRRVVPFDLEGKPWGRFDPPGAYADGNPRKGNFF